MHPSNLHIIPQTKNPTNVGLLLKAFGWSWARGVS